ncbi:flagellar basal body rod protein FlgB [Aquibacillus sp. 3ASR75-11]|uniref:Flagellar basal body rod protein FlgB n=1 Tax=Terrihalobacillus insolitus TaxID=2950438 RepID=A0A9X3WUE7_9BACI|nr:flagellar basal body rod protein FlgB [Terrihalobacillus insolitus]MDC3414142.1 flagellar basal body rod protein FlgB [Terrihalobacillus insolitus]MDC3423584.1 flagellar basal body rod protein FlgB [Terrihalobacillus insolitus]
MSLFGNTIQTLEQSLDYASLKNKTISNNIANVDTPNFKTKEVAFKSILNETLQSSTFRAKRTNPKHIAFGSNVNESTFKITTNQSTTYNQNGNNVDMDKEMTELAKNQIYYQSLVDRINGKFSSLQTVIRGGR